MRDGGLGSSKSSPVITAVREAIRTKVEGPGTDRFLAPEIEALFQLVVNGTLLTAANSQAEVPLA